MDMFIDGAFVPAISGLRQNVTNPATGAVIDTVPTADATDADRAITVAARAFEDWKRVPVSTRAAIQKKAAAAMRSEAEAIGRTLATELGRPLPAAIAEIRRSADLLDVYAEEGSRLTAEMPITAVAGEKMIVTREPVGVVIAITPFNYPITLLSFKLGAALIAGCTMVAKPAEDTPLSTLMLADLFHRAGLPEGVFNVVTGRGSGVGKAMIEHPVPRKVAFTGGTAAGKAIAATAVQTMKRLTLELGGQSPAIVCSDADLDRAAEAIARHAFANSGQFCYRVNRCYVERAVYPALVARLKTYVERLTVGDPFGEGVSLGPLVNEKIFRNSERQSEDARAKGARILTGGTRLTGGLYDSGWYFPPTLIADADHSMLVMTEETFGPVLGIMPFDDRSEALRLANNTRYGLAGFVFSQDLATALTMAEQIEAGSVWVNDIHRSSHSLPFGGMKESGFGREKGRYGIDAYLEYKSIYLSYDGRLR